jgi:hypothetical protein
MTKTLKGTWLAEVRDDSLCDRGPYYPELNEKTGVVIKGGWADAQWALLDYMSSELTDVTGRTSGPREEVDPDGSLDRLETRLVAVLKSLRNAEPEMQWDFQMDACHYRIFVAEAEVTQHPRLATDRVTEPFAFDAFVWYVSPHVIAWRDPTRHSRCWRSGRQG